MLHRLRSVLLLLSLALAALFWFLPNYNAADVDALADALAAEVSRG